MSAAAQVVQSVSNRQILKIDAIRDGGAQMRVEMNEQTVADYAEDMAGGAVFPPVIVYYDGKGHWLADGFHRVEATRKIGRATIEAEVHHGGDRDAILHGIGANARHGLRRTQADKRHAIETLLRDPGWSKWSDRHVAKVANVDHKTVGKIRREVLGGEIPSDRTVLFRDRHGNESEMQVNAAAPRPAGSVFQDFLRKISDEDLIAECGQRGLKVEVQDDPL